ncbi:uncharacterized protein LOC113296155 [Papaver somniferum]|uniref:uncharacterized protein LOC113296155 n=1 Tax=Papaver somniferum TaxID=3469 RepID=UPI000E6FAEC6|nr:uncharacterized protein LOC113296155 [Papaver somniferum]
MDPPRRKGTRMKGANRKQNEYNPGITKLVQKRVKKRTVEEGEFVAAETQEMARLRKLEKENKKAMKALSPPSRPPRVGDKLLTPTHRGAYVVLGTDHRHAVRLMRHQASCSMTSTWDLDKECEEVKVIVKNSGLWHAVESLNIEHDKVTIETESVLEMKDGRLSKKFNLKKLRDKLWETKKIFDKEGRDAHELFKQLEAQVKMEEKARSYVVEANNVNGDFYTNHQEMMGEQPLSKIFMHEFKLGIHAEASIKATTRLVGLKDCVLLPSLKSVLHNHESLTNVYFYNGPRSFVVCYMAFEEAN